MNKAALLLLCLALPLAAGFIGSLATTPAIPTWYASLNKPAFTPPSWVFAPAWTLLYLLMGVALYRVWKIGTYQPGVKRAVTFFLVHLLLNAGWSLAFFGLQNPLLGLLVILTLLVWVAVLIRRFYRLDKPAAYLLIPYLLWVAFATALNFSIWQLNP